MTARVTVAHFVPSLPGMRVITRVRRQSGIRLPARAIFGAPTAEQFSALIGNMAAMT